MKASGSNQNVLIITNDPELETILRPAYSKNAEITVAQTTEQALQILETNRIQTLLIDALTTDPKLYYFEESMKISFFEIMQYANQLNHGLTIILLVNKMLTQDGKFARKYGAALTMDRKAISVNVLEYVSEVLRKRTFRTILFRDLVLGATYPVEIYQYLPSNKRYSVFLQQDTAYTEEKQLRQKKS